MKKRYYHSSQIIADILLVAFIAIVALGLYDCPMNAIFHIPCLGCGITEAIFAFLRLDIESALRANSLFPLAILWGVYYILRPIIPMPRRVETALLILTLMLFLTRWVIIIFFI